MSTAPDQVSKQPVNIRIESAVYGSDGGRADTIDRVVIDPKRRQVTHLIVKKGSLLHNAVVPIEHVIRATEDRVRLDFPADALNRFPECREVDWVAPDPTSRPLDPYAVKQTLMPVDAFGANQGSHANRCYG